MKNHKHGFTLIELMVVISIIGLMASVVLAAMSSARTKARDTQRIRDLQEISKAIELYYDKYGYYPIRSALAAVVATSASGNANWSSLENALRSEGFLPTLSRDPVNSGSIMSSATGYLYRYQVNAGGTAYDLITRLETDHPLRCGRQSVRANVTFNNSGSLTIAGTPLCPHATQEATYVYNYLYLRGATVQ